MTQERFSKINTKLMKNFIICFLTYPAIMMTVMFMSMNVQILIKALFVMSILSVPGIIIIIFIYHLITKKLQYMIDNSIRTKKAVEFALKFPYTASGLFSIPLLTVAIIVSVKTYLDGILVTPYQMFFYIFIEILVVISLTLYHYYRLKIILHPVSSSNDMKSLAMSEKLIAPILSFMVIMLVFVGVGIYSINVNRTLEFYAEKTISQSEKAATAIDDSFQNIEIELHSLLNFISPEAMNQGNAVSTVKTLFSRRLNKSIETLFIVKNSGVTYNSSGSAPNIKDRIYFKNAYTEKRNAWSDLLANRDTGNKVLVCLVPKIINGSIEGAIGATISTESMESFIKSISTSDDTKYFIMNNEGKIIYHPDGSYLDKILGKDITDENGKDFNAFLNPENSEFHSYKINGNVLKLRKTRLNTSGHYIISAGYEKAFMQPVNDIIIRVIVAIMFINIMVFLIIYRTGKSFSTPIRNTIQIFRRLAVGDLTARSNDYLQDEFGDMIKNMKRFQDKIMEVVEQALNASHQLAASADQLAATSANLSDGAQNQAAAVEEATASLEEISSSNEMIADNSRLQSDFSRDTYKAMEDLGSFIRSVNNDALSALKVANVTTSEAKKGSELMQNTVKGMISIQENSLRIAEMVTMISDISDQVNLLALNAAIEAARAGDHGRGFAVVADEIGKLADKTAESAKSITGLVSNGVNSAKQGINDINETSKALENIINYINNTKELVQKIAGSTDEQTVASERVLNATKQVMGMSDSISNSTHEQTITHQEISKTMDQINEQTQAQAAGAEEIASSAEEISAQAESMKNLLEFFKTK